MQENDRKPEEEGTTERQGSGTADEKLVAEEEKSASYLANWQRTQADFINYKRRIEQERETFARSANASLIISLLPVLDDFESAFEHAPHRGKEKGTWIEGIRMVERKLRTALETFGLKPIEAVGEPFDPNLHEAVRQDSGEEGKVVAEVRKGYMLNDRVLRPSMVVVGNGEKEED